MIISLSGKMRSGKDLVASILQYLFNHDQLQCSYEVNEEDFNLWKANLHLFGNSWSIKKFAYPVKQICSIILDEPIERFEDEHFKNSILPEKWNTEHLNCSCSQLEMGYIQDHKCSNCDTPTSYISHTVRWLMQEIGTGIGRDIHPDLWCNIMTNQCIPIGYEQNCDPIYPNWIITDMRFQNEVDCLLPYAPILIRVERPFNQRFRKEINEWVDKCAYTGYEHDIEKAFMNYLKHGDEDKRNLYYSIKHESETALDNYSFPHYIYNEGSIEDLIIQCKELLQNLKLIR